MAEAEQVEAGLAGSAPSDDRAEPASVATLRAAPLPPDLAAAPEPPAAPGAATSDREPSASVRGVPTWTFALPSVSAPPAPPAPRNDGAAVARTPAAVSSAAMSRRRPSWGRSAPSPNGTR